MDNAPENGAALLRTQAHPFRHPTAGTSYANALSRLARPSHRFAQYCVPAELIMDISTTFLAWAAGTWKSLRVVGRDRALSGAC